MSHTITHDDNETAPATSRSFFTTTKSLYIREASNNSKSQFGHQIAPSTVTSGWAPGASSFAGLNQKLIISPSSNSRVGRSQTFAKGAFTTTNRNDSAVVLGTDSGYSHQPLQQDKAIFNSLDNQFNTKEHFLTFLEFKREMVSDIGRAHLQTYERKAGKQSKEYFFESRKGAQSLYHPLN